MESQKELIWKRDWNVLIILDACRYDFFEELYEEYLRGDLSKVRSSGSETREWLENTFFKEEKMDVTYYSANPYVSSLESSFSGSGCFENIEDLYLDEWDEEKKTVRPKVFNRVYNGEKPAILHYVQPHEPYFSIEGHSGIVWDAEIGGREGISLKLKKLIVPRLRKIFGEVRFRGLIKLLFGERPINRLEDTANQKGILELIEAYRENLRAALDSVQEIVKQADRSSRIIVTSDHGELLGEIGCFGHPSGLKVDVLRNVPWFVVDNEETKKMSEEEATK